MRAFTRMVAMRRPWLKPAQNPCQWSGRVEPVRNPQPRRGPRPIEVNPVSPMSVSDRTTAQASSSGYWIANQPYLLLCITAACWAGNAIVGRLAAGRYNGGCKQRQSK